MHENLSPMMRQYLQLKEKYKDCMLLFRLGDFYELFFEDAEQASRELELVLTGRDCGLEERAPMCGVPYHSVESYIAKLISLGHKVAICEQLSDPTGKGPVERDVVRVITPGTVIEESMLDEKKSNYILSVFLQDDQVGLAAADVSTGEFTLSEFGGENHATKLLDELMRIQPTEIIANEGFFMREQLAKSIQSGFFTSCRPGWSFSHQTAQKVLKNHFKVATLDGFGCTKLHYAVSAAGALLSYLNETQKNTLGHISSISVFLREDYMVLDAATRRNLELCEPLRHGGSKKGTLLYLLDQTQTSMGSRALRAWVERPLQKPEAIDERLDAIGELKDALVLREDLRIYLNEIYDIERLTSRIAYGTLNARDCLSLKKSLFQLPRIKELLLTAKSPMLNALGDKLDPLEDVCELLCRAIAAEPPVGIKEGGIILDGYNAEVDKYREAARCGREWVAKLEAKEREATGIKNLKVGYNRVFGYYLEVTKSYQQLVPYNYQRKQTLANAERYITEELKKLESDILGADEKCMELEYKLFTEIRETLLNNIKRLQVSASSISAADALQSLATVASQNNYCRPRMHTGDKLELVDARHPVVERTMSESFIANNTLLDNDENRILIITGPNMAGKSTYLRQVALITLLAHMGSFVPAKEAIIPMVDRIFTRVGASDDLSVGQSTFMVEMSELAGILNGASAKSLLILDEIGRGTATFDGLSIAWAVVEHLAKTLGAKTLFATHYHELSELEDRLSGVKNYRISVKEVGEDIIFLRRIVRGSADKSFGIQVARLAGMPKGIIGRAKEILAQLEANDINKTVKFDFTPAPTQMTLFAPGPDDIVSELLKLEVDSLTPINALNTLYELHARALALEKGKERAQ